MRGTIQAGKLWGQIYITSVFTLAPTASVVVPAGRELLAFQSDGAGDVNVELQTDTWRILGDAANNDLDGRVANGLTQINQTGLVSDGTNLRIHNAHAGNTYTANYYVYRVQEAEL